MPEMLDWGQCCRGCDVIPLVELMVALYLVFKPRLHVLPGGCKFVTFWVVYVFALGYALQSPKRNSIRASCGSNLAKTLVLI